MKKLLTVLFLFVAATSFGQVQQKLPQNYVSPSYQIDSNQAIPLGISRLRSVNGGRNIGQIRYNQADSSFYIYSGTRWIKFASYAIVPVPQGTTTGIDSITFTAPRTLCYWKNDTSTCYTLANSIDSAKVIGGTQLCFYVGGVSTCYGITGNVVSSAIDSITISGTNYCWWHNNTPKCVSINNTTAFDTTHIYAVLNRLEFKMDTLRKVFFSRDGSIIASYSADWDTVFAEVDTNKISAMIYAIINGGASSHTDPLAIQSIRAVSDSSFENTHGDGSLDTVIIKGVGVTNVWETIGNSGTDPTINFIGTTDNVPLYFRVYNDTIVKFGTSYNVSMGIESNATGVASMAFGNSVSAPGFASIAMGVSSIASGDFSVAIGNANKAMGNMSTTIGNTGYSSGIGAMSAGINDSAFANYSRSFGFGTYTNTDTSTIVGKYNDTTVLNEIFAVGDGTNYTSRHNALTVLRNGNTGIGTITPDSAFTNQLGLWSKRGVRFSGLIQSGFDTSTYKPVVINSSGTLSKMNWPASSSVTLAAGTYTPTATIVSNLDATPTLSVCQYSRVGNTVTVSGEITVDPTTGAGTLTRARFTLPIASALTISAQCSGNANIGIAGTVALGAAIKGDAINDQAEIAFGATYTSSLTYNFSFTYQVL